MTDTIRPENERAYTKALMTSNHEPADLYTVECEASRHSIHCQNFVILADVRDSGLCDDHRNLNNIIDLCLHTLNVGPNARRLRIQSSAPEPVYPCEGINAGLEPTEHFPQETGYYNSDDLYYASFIIPEFETQFGGFWCQDCLNMLSVPKGQRLSEYLTRDRHWTTGTGWREKRTERRGHLLVPQRLAVTIPSIQCQRDQNTDPGNYIARIRLFIPNTHMEWYIVEFDATTGECFGYGGHAGQELGTFYIRDISAIRFVNPSVIAERDLRWLPKPIKNFRKQNQDGDRPE